MAPAQPGAGPLPGAPCQAGSQRGTPAGGAPELARNKGERPRKATGPPATGLLSSTGTQEMGLPWRGYRCIVLWGPSSLQ